MSSSPLLRYTARGIYRVKKKWALSGLDFFVWIIRLSRLLNVIEVGQRLRMTICSHSAFVISRLAVSHWKIHWSVQSWRWATSQGLRYLASFVDHLSGITILCWLLPVGPVRAASDRVVVYSGWYTRFMRLTNESLSR